jgi:hypothetical protein
MPCLRQNRDFFAAFAQASGMDLAPIRGARSFAVVAFVILAPGLYGQEGLRNTLANDAAATSQAQAQSLQAYTFKSGDFKMLIVPSLETEWNDNINAAGAGSQLEDYIIRPRLALTVSYPLTDQNVLTLTGGIGYSDYLEHGQYSTLDISSGSQISLNSSIKGFLVNVHDRMQYSQDSTQEPAIAGTGLFGSFQNTAGLSVTWKPRNVIVTLGYDHLNYISSSSAFGYMDHSSELPSARVGYVFGPSLTAGVEATATFTSYDQMVLNDSQSYTAGVYANWKPGSNLQIQPRVGFVTYQFNNTSQSDEVFFFGRPPPMETIETADVSTWYADLAINYKIAQALTSTLDVGHEDQLGIQSDLNADSYARASLGWTITKEVSLRASASYQYGQVGVGNVQGNVTGLYDWIGFNLSATYALMKRLSLSLNYRLAVRSGGALGDYTQNVVGLQLTYRPL